MPSLSLSLFIVRIFVRESAMNGPPYDCIVVGAGPAGLSASLFLTQTGLIWVDEEWQTSVPRVYAAGAITPHNLPWLPPRKGQWLSFTFTNHSCLSSLTNHRDVGLTVLHCQALARLLLLLGTSGTLGRKIVQIEVPVQPDRRIMKGKRTC